MMSGYSNTSWSGTDTTLAALLALAVAVAFFAWFRPRRVVTSKKKATK